MEDSGLDNEEHRSDSEGDETATVFPIVGVGASAGGLEAFEKFFLNMAPDSGMGFILVQHLDPTHDSILTDLLKKYTRMPVHQVEDEMVVEPNAIYVIPPNRDMALHRGALHLMEPSAPRGMRLPIDFFFRSLAHEQKENAIGVVLSGTGTDGALGLKAIKGEGGLTMVQDPESAKYDGMPRSAIGTGLVDAVLPPDQMGAQLIDYVSRAFSGESRQDVEGGSDFDHVAEKAFILIREQTGHDFSGYKENTVNRRIERRMAVNQIQRPRDYVRFLNQNPLEIETLFRELLIGVTSFFRDRKAYEALKEKAIAPICDEIEDQRPLRVWVSGCSTGEEAYSIAMLMRERLDRLKQGVEVQVFATDIDRTALEKAREGRYPDSIAADVSPERLKRFFTKEKNNNMYKIGKTLRDMVIFAVQSIIKDPPFSKLDLISCRNLLIYLGGDLQKKILPLFHYALKPNGFLFLGTSETLGAAHELFKPIDRKAKIFQKIETGISPRTIIEFPTDSFRKRKHVLMTASADKKMDFREFTEQFMLENYSPSGVVINEKGEILYFYGRTGKFLEPASGNASNNLLRMAREGLRAPLTTAVRKVAVEKQTINIKDVQVRSNGQRIHINLSVRPINRPAAMNGLLIVVFDEVPSPEQVDAPESSDSEDETRTTHRIIELEQELKSTREYLHTTIEELETTNEELKSSNEELQSSNEELQSTNEELETSKEELQSVNEELMTVNAELHNKIEELTAVNNDLNNLLVSTDVATIFLDLDLRIKRFTPPAKKIVDLIDADIGRPIGQFVSNLKYNDLIKDARHVLDTLDEIKTSVQTHDQRWYIMRIMPYRTMNNGVDGLVLTFSNITEQKTREKELEASREKVTDILASIKDGFFSLDEELHITYLNLAAEKMLGIKKEDVQDIPFFDAFPEAKDSIFEERFRQSIANGENIEFETWFEPHQNWYEVHIFAQKEGLSVYFQIVNERKEAEREIRKRERMFRTLAENARDVIARFDRKGRHLYVNPIIEKIAGKPVEAFIGKTNEEVGMPESLCTQWNTHREQVYKTGETQRIEFEFEDRDGDVRRFECLMAPEFDDDETVATVMCISRDISHRKKERCE